MSDAKPAPRKANAASRAAAAAAAAAAAGAVVDSGIVQPASVASRKRRADGNVKDGASSHAVLTPEHRAASRIQAFVRGAKARTIHRSTSLWNAWNELDWREEAELMRSHGAYEKLKAAVQARKKADEEEDGGATDGKKKAKPSPKKGKGKKGAASAISDEEQEASMGLLLRDKDPVTMAWVETLLDCFKRNLQCPISLVMKLLGRITPLLKELPNIVPVAVNARVTVVGDLHGQLDDLLAIFKLQGIPSARNRFVFNGDFVDRGQWSCECILTLLAWKLLLPHDVFLNRGNHEARDINGRDGFERECHEKYGSRGAAVFDAFSECFAALPIVHIIEQQVFITHGGLYGKTVSLKDIAKIDRFQEIPESGSLLEEGLWSDPKPGKGRSESPRGAGLLFGPDVTKDFLAANKPLNLIVRSHECMTKGYKSHHHDQVITYDTNNKEHTLIVFSASNYCGTVGNDGGLIVFERDSGTVLGSTPVKPDLKGPPASPRGPRAHSGADGAAAASSSAAAATAAPSAAPPSSPAASLRTRVPKKHEVPLHVPASQAAAAHAAGLMKLKRSIVTFYAAKKEKSASYRVTPESNLETDIVSKLLHLISDSRLALINYWSNKAVQHSSGVATITRQQWAAGLKSCLGLQHMPFHEKWVQELLGLPKLGVDGKANGPIDFMAFLLRFRPVNLVVLRAQRTKRSALSTGMTQDGGMSQDSMMGDEFCASLEPSPEDLQDDEATVASMQQILEVLHKKRFELESLFRFLDVDGNENVSHAEFKEGMKSLQAQLGTNFSSAQIDALLRYIDVDGDECISYAEFLNSFQLADEKFNATIERSQSIRDGRANNGGTGSGKSTRSSGSHSPASAASAVIHEDVDEDAPTPPQTPPPRSPEPTGSLSPQHANDESPPHDPHDLNPPSDHDDTSSSHMARPEDVEAAADDEAHSHMHTRALDHELAAAADTTTGAAAADAAASAEAEEPHAKRARHGSR